MQSIPALMGKVGGDNPWDFLELGMLFFFLYKKKKWISKGNSERIQRNPKKKKICEPYHPNSSFFITISRILYSSIIVIGATKWVKEYIIVFPPSFVLFGYFLVSLLR